jgi:hypothetical protein
MSRYIFDYSVNIEISKKTCVQLAKNQPLTLNTSYKPKYPDYNRLFQNIKMQSRN